MCNNIIHFRLENDITIATRLNKIANKDLKIIFERPDFLFSDKVVFVEGITDYIFLNEFLSAHNINNYHVLETGGCGSKIWEFADKIGLTYSSIFDLDKLVGFKPGPTAKLTINSTCVNFILKRVNKNTNIYQSAVNFMNDSIITSDIISNILLCTNNKQFYFFIFIQTLNEFYNTDLIYNFDNFDSVHGGDGWKFINLLQNEITKLNISINTMEFLDLLKFMYKYGLHNQENTKNYKKFIENKDNNFTVLNNIISSKLDYSRIATDMDELIKNKETKIKEFIYITLLIEI